MSEANSAGSAESAVLTERHGRVLIVRFNRPDVRNAVNGGIASGVERAIDELEIDDGLWVGVLTGNGPVFCAGADLELVSRGDGGQMRTQRGGFGGFVRRVRTKPVIAALNGPAVAGGMEIALACDLIVAAQGSVLGIPEVKRSLLAAAGGLVRLPELVGEKAAMELALTGDPWPAERLMALGLVSRVVPPAELIGAALGLAEAICRNAPLAVRAARRCIVDGRGRGEDARWEQVAREMSALSITADYQEGPRAFLEGREPAWKGH